MSQILSPILDYYQPDFYRFSEDSIKLVSKAIDKTKGLKEFILGDYGCGCGVLGLEFAQRSPDFKRVDLIEAQSDFIPYALKNKELFFKDDANIHVINENILSRKDTYDIILSNLPYFDPSSNRLGDDERRNKCRFFLQGSFEELLDKIISDLKPKGHAFILLNRPNREILDKYLSNYELEFLYKDTFLLNFTLNEEAEKNLF